MSAKYEIKTTFRFLYIFFATISGLFAWEFMNVVSILLLSWIQGNVYSIQAQTNLIHVLTKKMINSLYKFKNNFEKFLTSECRADSPTKLYIIKVSFPFLDQEFIWIFVYVIAINSSLDHVLNHKKPAKLARHGEIRIIKRADYVTRINGLIIHCLKFFQELTLRLFIRSHPLQF